MLAMNPLMPKGVEHYPFHIELDFPFKAMNPLMPQGVEHDWVETGRPGVPGAAITSDAERR